MSIESKWNCLINSKNMLYPTFPHLPSNSSSSSMFPSHAPLYYSGNEINKQKNHNNLYPMTPKSLIKIKKPSESLSVTATSSHQPNSTSVSSPLNTATYQHSYASSGQHTYPIQSHNLGKETGKEAHLNAIYFSNSPRNSPPQETHPSSSSSSNTSSQIYRKSVVSLPVPSDLYTAVTSSDNEYEDKNEQTKNKVDKNEDNLTKRNILLFKAHLSEKLFRFSDTEKYAIQLCQQRVKDGIPFSVDESQMLQIGLKKSISTQRTKYKVLQNLIQKEEELTDKESKQRLKLYKLYSNKLKVTIAKNCEKLLNLFLNLLLPIAENPKNQIMYMKMIADYFRYISEFTTALTQLRNQQNAQKMYSQTMHIAKKELQPYDAIFLDLALNWAVFHYDVLSNKKEALKIAKEAFNKAVDNIEMIDDEEYKETAFSLQLIKQNITRWKSNEENIFTM